MGETVVFQIPDDQRLKQFFEREKAKNIALMNKSYGIGEEDAKDVYQESCLALFENIHSGKLDTLTASLSTYFTGICKNQARKLLRSRKKTLNIDDLVQKEPKDDYSPTRIQEILGLSDSGMGNDEIKMLRRLVSNLPPPCEEILWSYYADGFDMKSIAARINFNGADSVKAKKSQCMSKLKQRFDELKSRYYDR